MSQHEPQFQRPGVSHETHILPITALAYLNDDIVLAGEGSFLCAYDEQERTRLGQWRIFESQAIHGIVVDSLSRDILVFGGRLLSIGRLNTNTKLVFIDQTQLEIDDWILDASFHDAQAALVTAHNALLTVDHSVAGTEWFATPQVDGSNTILYCAHIQQVSKNDWLIAAGTAFGDVIIWSCQLSNGTVTTTIHYSFSAHEGSTFGVRISDRLSDMLLGHRTRLLVSCSDDRTVRVWDISDLSAVASATFDRSTGFGSRIDMPEDGSRPALLAKAMGHVSRIWHVRFDQSDRNMSIKSFGEDATTISWSLQQSGNSNSYKLVQIHVFGANAGKHIWSVASNSKGLFIVGGSDGAIACVPSYHSSLSDQELEVRSSQGKDVLKAYAFLDEHTIVTTTQRGSIISYKLNQSHFSTMHTFERPDLANYSLVAAAPGVAFVGGSHGTIYAYLQDSSTLLPIDCGRGKITALFASSVNRTDTPSVTAVLVAKINETKVVLKLLQHQPEELGLLRESYYDLPQSFNITASTHIRLDSGDFLSILGSRDGMVAFYKEESSPVFTGPMHTETITALLWHAVEYAQGTLLGHLFSTSRDGTYAIHEVHMSDGKPSIDLIHQLELPFGPNIGGLSLTSGQLLVWGFRSTYFVVYSINTQRELFIVDCGGAHRNWAVWPRVDGLTFVWTKASRVFVKHFRQSMTRLIRVGGHGREVKSMAVKHNKDKSALVATGAQDTNIRLFTVPAVPGHSGSTDLSCLHILRQHNTGPQHLAFSDEGDYLFSSGGFEEFFIWRVTQSCPIFGTGVVCESVYPRSRKSDLRIMGFETRRRAGNNWQIAMAYSDSRVALWSYNKAHDWRHLVEADYLTSCPTAILQPAMISPSKYLTTSTDGHIGVWQYDADPEKLAWISRHRAHQGAILCSCYHQLSDSYLMIITGGDDNAIALTTLNNDDARLHTRLISRAHAAAVTALVVVKPSKDKPGDVLYLISAGLDQRLIMWEITTASVTTIKKLRVISSSVADISSIGVLPTNTQATIRVLVSGIGLEIWNIPLYGRLLAAT